MGIAILLCQRAMQGVGVPGDVIYGYCLWRGGHDPQPSWVHVSSTVDPGHTCKLQSASLMPLALSSTSWLKAAHQTPRGFGSKKPSWILDPAAALMGSEGSQTA